MIASRSAEDAVFYVAKRRLATHDAGTHQTYAQLECARLVVRLRAIRDIYREHLEELCCRPLGQMYWVVFRFGVMDWAVRFLRSAVRNYVTLAAIHRRDWEDLFGPLTPVPLGEAEACFSEHEIVLDGAELEASINRRLRRGCFDEIIIGGPLGRDAQFSLAREMAGPAMMRGETLEQILERREKLWDRCSFWTERVAWMFDAVQEELMAQADALPEEGRRSEDLFPGLTLLEQIVYKHLVSLRPLGEDSVRLGKPGWLALTRDLDLNGVSLDQQLPPTARKVLTSLRRKHTKIDSWEAAYLSLARTSLEDGRRRSIREELRIFIHNEAKRVEHLLNGSQR